MGEYTYSIDRVDEDGIFNHGTLNLNTGGKTYNIPLPAKTIPVKHCSAERDIYSEFKHINEVYHTIDSIDLRNAIYEEQPSFVDDIKQKLKYSDPDQLDLVLLNYAETKVMTPLEAQEFVRAVDEVSDIITCPLQFPLLHALVDDEPVDAIDDPFHYFKTTKENFLEEAAALESSKPVMGSLSFLRTGRLNQLIQLYSDFNVEMFGVDFYREHPTSVIDGGLGVLIGHLSAFDLFEGSLMLAYNMARRPNRTSSPVKRAENFAPVGMGFDLLCGNHLGLEYVPEDDQTNYWVFDPDVAGYQPIGVDSVIQDWPVTVQSSILPEQVAEFHPKTANKLIKLVNAEQMQSTLFELRGRLEGGDFSNFLDNKGGVDLRMTDAFQSALEAYQAGIGPGLDDYR